MPLVGFDEQKNRLGMGGGFYDRTLAFKKHQKHTHPKLIGLAFDCQKIDLYQILKFKNFSVGLML
jgi:5-formyltetrahydrofolate cyclo-ligase